MTTLIMNVFQAPRCSPMKYMGFNVGIEDKLFCTKVVLIFFHVFFNIFKLHTFTKVWCHFDKNKLILNNNEQKFRKVESLNKLGKLHFISCWDVCNGFLKLKINKFNIFNPCINISPENCIISKSECRSLLIVQEITAKLLL